MTLSLGQSYFLTLFQNRLSQIFPFRSSKSRQRAPLTTGWSRNYQNIMTGSPLSDITAEPVARSSTHRKRLKNLRKMTIWERERSKHSLKMNGGTKILTIIRFLMFESEFKIFNLFHIGFQNSKNAARRKLSRARNYSLFSRNADFSIFCKIWLNLSSA